MIIMLVMMICIYLRVYNYKILCFHFLFSVKFSDNGPAEVKHFRDSNKLRQEFQSV
jgi:hypothetical protein